MGEGICLFAAESVELKERMMIFWLIIRLSRLTHIDVDKFSHPEVP